VSEGLSTYHQIIIDMFIISEASYFLSRLLQRVESLAIVPEAYPAGTLPPPEWKNGKGRQVYEKVWPKSHLTIYCNVRADFLDDSLMHAHE
jgi:hypothetical protein